MNRVVYSKPGKRTLRPAVVLEKLSYDSLGVRSNMQLYEVYDIVNGDNHIVAEWSLEA